ncbi:MAG: AsmA-like C-terminal region-containing protein [Gammaproteobacteria bacterium]
MELKQVRGALNFSNDGVGARDLQALFRGSPVRLDIDTRAQRKIGKVVDFRLSGQFGAAALFGAQAAAFAPYLQGQSDWDVLLSVPERRPGVPGAVQIKLDSDLGGMAVQLPQPLAKTGKAKRAFSARIAITESALDLSLEYAPDVRAVLVLARSAKTVRLTRGELRIASGDAKLPAEPGLKIVARLPHLDLAMLGAGSALPIPVSGVDARIDEIGLAGAVLRDTQVQMQPRAGALAIRLTGKDVAGTLQVPTEARASQPLQIRLERLALRRTTGRETADDGGAARDGDPRQWPPLEVDIGELFVNDRSLGRLHFATAPTAQGLRLRELQLRSDWHQLSVEGDWRITADGASSRLQAQFASRELGRSLAAFGYELALAKGDAKAQATLAWPGGFADFSLAALQGQLKLHIGKGQLLQVDPGMGRVIGLLNLYALTRRLQLDFSDLFEDGLAFDEISGRLDFGNGKAQIDHLTLSGPAAQIAVGGSLDLQHKRFDQTIAVMPRLGAPLALAGAVAGGPVVGAAVLVAEQLLKPGIGKIVRYQYQVTGPWDDPVVERDGGAPGDHSATSGFKR